MTDDRAKAIVDIALFLACGFLIGCYSGSVTLAFGVIAGLLFLKDYQS